MNLHLSGIICVFVAVVGLISCASHEIRQELKEIESYIQDCPDTALTVLEQIDSSELKHRRDRAYHALLHAMALDKNYIDVSDDSLASTALSYFSRRGPKRYYAQSLYYLGLSYYYAKEYDKAIIEFTRCEKIAETHDSLYLGFVKVAQADTYSKTYNQIEELHCLETAYEIFKHLKSDRYISAVGLRLAQTYSERGNTELALSLFESLLVSDLDKRVMSSVITSYALAKTRDDIRDYAGADSLYRLCSNEYQSYSMTYIDYWAWSYAMECIGKKEDSDMLIRQLEQLDTSITGTYWKYRLNRINGDHSQALSLLEKTVLYNEKEVSAVLEQSLSRVQRDYFDSLSEVVLLRLKIKNSYLTIAVIVVIALLLALYILYKKREVEKNKLLAYVEEVKRQLVDFKSGSYSQLKSRFVNLYKSRFETLSELCEEYLKNAGRTDLESLMYRKVRLMVEDIRNDAIRIKTFEKILDSELDNIMSNFRNEMSKCKESDIVLFSYLVAGFDLTTISRLMDMTLNNVYAHKRRLRIKIEEKSPEHRDQFLEMLGFL